MRKAPAARRVALLWFCVLAHHIDPAHIIPHPSIVHPPAMVEEIQIHHTRADIDNHHNSTCAKQQNTSNNTTPNKTHKLNQKKEIHNTKQTQTHKHKTYRKYTRKHDNTKNNKNNNIKYK
jgi:hypothetical protein